MECVLAEKSKATYNPKLFTLVTQAVNVGKIWTYIVWDFQLRKALCFAFDKNGHEKQYTAVKEYVGNVRNNLYHAGL